MSVSIIIISYEVSPNNWWSQAFRSGGTAASQLPSSAARSTNKNKSMQLWNFRFPNARNKLCIVSR